MLLTFIPEHTPKCLTGLIYCNYNIWKSDEKFTAPSGTASSLHCGAPQKAIIKRPGLYLIVLSKTQAMSTGWDFYSRYFVFASSH